MKKKERWRKYCKKLWRKADTETLKTEEEMVVVEGVGGGGGKQKDEEEIIG